MISYLKNELGKLKVEIKTLEIKPVVLFLSVSLIVFSSMTLAAPSFYYDHFAKDRLGSRFYWFLVDGSIMFITPVLIIKLILKEKLSDYGLKLGDLKFGLITAGIFLAFMLPVVWIVSASEDFARTYPQGGSVLRENFGLFILYELSILVYMLGWEFLWRGYFLFGLKEKFGYYAIFIQMIPFFILHRGKPDLELFASIFAGLILGVQALRANSFIYAWVLHWIVMLSIDSISIYRYSNNFYKLF